MVRYERSGISLSSEDAKDLNEVCVDLSSLTTTKVDSLVATWLLQVPLKNSHSLLRRDLRTLMVILTVPSLIFIFLGNIHYTTRSSISPLSGTQNEPFIIFNTVEGEHIIILFMFLLSPSLCLSHIIPLICLLRRHHLQNKPSQPSQSQ